jgi:hypothetical protein
MQHLETTTILPISTVTSINNRYITTALCSISIIKDYSNLPNGCVKQW